MPIQPDAPTGARRPFEGFERESAVYERLKPGLLEAAPGKYIVLVGEEWVGPEDTYSAALRAGYRRFGRGPLFVKPVLRDEPATEVSRAITPCRP